MKLKWKMKSRSLKVNCKKENENNFLIFKLFMNLILIITSFFLFFIYLFPQYYISELAISFLPYIIVFCLIIITFLCWSLVRFVTKLFNFLNIKDNHNINSKLYKQLRKKILIRFIFFVIFSILFILYFIPFKNFYHWTDKKTSTETWLKVFYANIYKDNANYTWIENLIKQNDPDLIMFVEFTDHHYQYLQDFLKKNYPFVNRTSWSQEFIWSMVFSKTPIENLIVNYPQWMRRYWYFSMLLNWKNYYFYLVHTSSPSSYENFKMRNDQLEVISKDFILHEKKRNPDRNILMIWDFNISPRSVFYQKFKSDLSLSNYTQNAPILFTRRLKELPIFWSHIDQIFINSWVEIWGLKTINIPWSDHLGYSFQIHE